jgi:hypothetical protein
MIVWTLLIPGLLLLALCLVAWVAEREPTPERIDRRLTEDEMALTGEDWRVHVEPYFRKRRNHDRIIREVTGTWNS